MPERKSGRPLLTRSGSAGRIYNYELHELIFGLVYLCLMGNLLLSLVSSPLVVMLATTNPQSSWPVLALLSPLAVAGFVGLFAVFHEATMSGSRTVVRDFFRYWWRYLRKSLLVGLLVAAIFTAATLNIRFFLSSQIGALVIPIQVMILLVTLIVGITALVAIPEFPRLKLAKILQMSLGLGIRRWYLTIPALGILALLLGIIIERPAIGLGVAAAPLLFAVWGLCRFALQPALPKDSPTPDLL